jgi:hypothetical protein
MSGVDDAAKEVKGDIRHCDGGVGSFPHNSRGHEGGAVGCQANSSFMKLSSRTECDIKANPERTQMVCRCVAEATATIPNS